jgi:hypothetical protein
MSKKGGKSLDEVKISSSSSRSPAMAIEGNKSGGVEDELLHFERQLETDLLKTIQCQENPAKGTVIIAKQDIPAGTTVLEEPAFAWQPLEDRIYSVCHHCMTEIPRFATHACPSSSPFSPPTPPYKLIVLISNLCPKSPISQICSNFQRFFACDGPKFKLREQGSSQTSNRINF